MMVVIGIVAGVVVIALGAIYYVRREKARRSMSPHDIYPHW
jgi:hypothetical protein